MVALPVIDDSVSRGSDSLAETLARSVSVGHLDENHAGIADPRDGMK